MVQQIKVYISAKLEHAKKLSELHVDGIHINARWIEMAESGRQRLKPVSHWQQENFDDIDAAHFFILYTQPEDDLKGSLFEIGYAVAAGKKCWIAGNGQLIEVKVEGAVEPLEVPNKAVLPWALYRQWIRIVGTLDQAFLNMKQLIRPNAMVGLNGEPLPAPEF